MSNDEIEDLRNQLGKAAMFGKQLMMENQELKSRASEDEIKMSSLSQQIKKLEDVNARIIKESGDQIDTYQNDNKTQIEELNKSLTTAKNEIIELKTERSQLITDKEDALYELKTTNENNLIKVNELKKELVRVKSESEKLKKKDPDEDNVIAQLMSENNTLSQTNQELSLRLSQSIEQLKIFKADSDRRSEELTLLRSEKQNLEKEKDELEEQKDDYECELQQLRSAAQNTKGPSIAAEGNSLFSEVEDQRKKTANELHVLESTYKDKIDKFSDMEIEIEQLRSENAIAKYELSCKISTEQRNERLIEELRSVREERDILLQIGYRRDNKLYSEGESDLEKENCELKRKIGHIYLQQNAQHDSLRRADMKLQLLEKQNSELQKQITDMRRPLLGVTKENSPPKLETITENTGMSQQMVPVLTKPRKESSEYPADEEHKKMIKQFENDYPEENCKQQ